MKLCELYSHRISFWLTRCDIWAFISSRGQKLWSVELCWRGDAVSWDESRQHDCQLRHRILKLLPNANVYPRPLRRFPNQRLRFKTQLNSINRIIAQINLLSTPATQRISITQFLRKTNIICIQLSKTTFSTVNFPSAQRDLSLDEALWISCRKENCWNEILSRLCELQLLTPPKRNLSLNFRFHEIYWRFILIRESFAKLLDLIFCLRRFFHIPKSQSSTSIVKIGEECFHVPNLAYLQAESIDICNAARSAVDGLDSPQSKRPFVGASVTRHADDAPCSFLHVENALSRCVAFKFLHFKCS